MKSSDRVLKTSPPLYLEGTNGKAVLVQHGYNGYPREMYSLAKRLHAEGYTVVVPRLPGHATNAADFRKSNWKQWYLHVRNEYLNLQSRFDWVAVAGLSMGGVLSLLMAEEFNPVKIILLAPAMAVKQKLVYFTPFLRFILPSIKREWPVEPDADEDRITMGREYWSRHYTAQIANLVRLMKIAKKRLHEVVCPVYIMLSNKDSTVPSKAGDIIEKGVAGYVTRLNLKDSPHVFFEGPEEDFVINKVVEWLEAPEEQA